MGALIDPDSYEKLGATPSFIQLIVMGDKRKLCCFVRVYSRAFPVGAWIPILHAFELHFHMYRNSPNHRLNTRIDTSLPPILFTSKRFSCSRFKEKQINWFTTKRAFEHIFIKYQSVFFSQISFVAWNKKECFIYQIDHNTPTLIYFVILIIALICPRQ